MFGGFWLYKLAEKKGIINEFTESMKQAGKWKVKLLALKKCIIIILPVVLQVTDSLLDAVYFIRQKTAYRIIDIPEYVHIAQGVLLFTCELS